MRFKVGDSSVLKEEYAVNSFEIEQGKPQITG
jgi:hypothetical protein